MRWSLNTYQTGQDWELDYLIKTSAEAGYHGIEFLMDFDQKHGLEWDTPEARFDEVKARMGDAGLETASLTSCKTFDSAEAAERSTSVDRVKRVIDMAARMGCSHVRVLGDRFTDETRDAVIQQVGESLAALGEYAQPAGVTVSIEMHSDFTDLEPALKAMAVASQPNVGLVFNSVWRGVTDDTVD